MQSALFPRWLFWSLVAVVSWGIWGILSKAIGNAISPAQIQAISTIGMLPLLIVLARAKERTAEGNPRRGVWLAVAAGTLSCLGNIPYYSALASGAKASVVIPLAALYPVVTVLLAITLLKERLNSIQAVGIAFAAVAIYLFNIQREENFLSVWLLAALAAAVLWGITGFLQKVTTNHISASRSAFWFLAAFVPIGIAIAVWDPIPRQTPSRVWILSILMGFTLAAGNVAILVALAKEGKASTVVPLTGLYPLISISLAVFVFDEHVGLRGWIGVVVALAAIAMLSYEPPAVPRAAQRLGTETHP